MELEFTTTACNRPELLFQTYKSYTSKLKGIDFNKSTLYINIDPSPNNENINKVINVCQKFFGKVITRIPEKPNFTFAVWWLFNQPKGKYFFHLEDDWVLMEEIHIKDMIKRMEKKNSLQLILNKKKMQWSGIVNNKIKSSHHFTKPKNGLEPEPALVPGLWNTNHFRKIYLEKFQIHHNPEHTIKINWRKNWEYNIKNTPIIFWNPGTEISKDIGREWRSKKKINRKYQKNHQWNTWNIK
jgi:hypothetical protein